MSAFSIAGDLLGLSALFVWERWAQGVSAGEPASSAEHATDFVFKVRRHAAIDNWHAFSTGRAVGTGSTFNVMQLTQQGAPVSKPLAAWTVCAVALFAGAIPGVGLAQAAADGDDLAGAWRGPMQFTSGAFAATRDLELMYAFAAGGTMTESSNYDAMPPVPPAYGVWRKVGPRKYEAKYQFFQAKPVPSADELVKGGGWAPNGYGMLTQTFTLTADGNAFESRATLEMFDKDGKAVGGGEATAKGKRIGF